MLLEHERLIPQGNTKIIFLISLRSRGFAHKNQNRWFFLSYT